MSLERWVAQSRPARQGGALVHGKGPLCDCPGCVLAHARRDGLARLPIFTVYRPPDEDLVVVRLWMTDQTTVCAWRYPSLTEARLALARLALVPLARDPDDDPVIVESWL